jgi:hypothetical protein
MQSVSIPSRLRHWSIIATILFGTASSSFAAFTNFITRTGSTIKEGGSIYRYVGMNLPEVTHIRTDFNLREAGRFRFPTCSEIEYLVSAAAQSHSKVIRTWCFPSVYDSPQSPNTGTQVPYEFSFFYLNSDNTTVTLNETAFALFDYLMCGYGFPFSTNGNGMIRLVLVTLNSRT